jgi:large subunit ribosomal protein LP0
MVVKSKKPAYFAKLVNLLETCPKALIVDVDFVGSKQMQEIRGALRGKATVLMGKNTMIRTCLRNHAEVNPDLGLDKLLEGVNGNIGFIFCHGDMDEIRTICTENKVDAAAKAGVLAPCDVELPMGPTGLDPSSTNFFQVLNIPTKIVKGSIELTTAVKVCNVGQKVSASQAVLLAKMGIKPFSYGMKVVSVFDSGSLFDAAVLDITDDKVVSMFMGGVANIAALSREIGVPTEASMPHAVSAALKNMAALCADIDFTFPEIQPLKDFLADPTAFAAAAASAAPAAGGGGAAKKEEAAPVQEEEEEEDMDFDLFG